MRFVPMWALAALFLTACGDDGAAGEPDAGPEDAGVDAFVPPRDLGPSRDLSCAGRERCCVVDGEPTCVDPQSDEANCGLCGMRCDEGRGTECVLGFCVCGDAVQGCQGSDASLCCPPSADRTQNYCANLTEDVNDCGACGTVCEPEVADRCAAGTCVCGVSREGCAGTIESTCCADTATVECHDLRYDRFHCGRCNRRCEIDESCAEGTCTIGPEVCEETCEGSRICCGGECCTRGACVDGACVRADAGMEDAGAEGPDGGV